IRKVRERLAQPSDTLALGTVRWLEFHRARRTSIVGGIHENRIRHRPRCQGTDVPQVKVRALEDLFPLATGVDQLYERPGSRKSKDVVQTHPSSARVRRWAIVVISHVSMRPSGPLLDVMNCERKPPASCRAFLCSQASR